MNPRVSLEEHVSPPPLKKNKWKHGNSVMPQKSINHNQGSASVETLLPLCTFKVLSWSVRQSCRHAGDHSGAFPSHPDQRRGNPPPSEIGPGSTVHSPLCPSSLARSQGSEGVATLVCHEQGSKKAVQNHIWIWVEWIKVKSTNRLNMFHSSRRMRIIFDNMRTIWHGYCQGH